eukprot:NODE_493_length_7764_cov_0.561644.p3 type:complete len:231 gc:universal NODE_493_length_7764_cov_0.561644:7494-6802(-)
MSTQIFDIPLNEQRQFKVKDIVSKLEECDSLVDFGCGSGMMLGLLINFQLVKRIIAVDQQEYYLRELVELLQYTDRDIQHLRKKPLTIEAYKGDILKYDARLVKKDLLISIEVIEHLQIDAVHGYSKLIFMTYQPKYVIISTPNYDFNKMMGWDRFRNLDHKFEWTRKQFIDWCDSCCKYGYSYNWDGCGLKNGVYATQFSVFSRISDPQPITDMCLELELFQQIVYPCE